MTIQWGTYWLVWIPCPIVLISHVSLEDISANLLSVSLSPALSVTSSSFSCQILTTPPASPVARYCFLQAVRANHRVILPYQCQLLCKHSSPDTAFLSITLLSPMVGVNSLRRMAQFTFGSQRRCSNCTGVMFLQWIWGCSYNETNLVKIKTMMVISLGAVYKLRPRGFAYNITRLFARWEES